MPRLIDLDALPEKAQKAIEQILQSVAESMQRTLDSISLIGQPNTSSPKVAYTKKKRKLIQKVLAFEQDEPQKHTYAKRRFSDIGKTVIEWFKENNTAYYDKHELASYINSAYEAHGKKTIQRLKNACIRICYSKKYKHLFESRKIEGTNMREYRYKGE